MRENQKVITLNDAQRQATDHINGQMLVVAGAGTGKTSVIVERLVRLIEHGIAKKNILALTFTEKAAQEMLDRVSDRLNESYGVDLNIYTFNAFGAQRLNEFAVEIGLSSNQKLIGDNGKIVLLRENLESLGLEYFAPISNPNGQLTDVANYFSKLKQQLIRPEEYRDYASKIPADSVEEKLDKQRHSELARAYITYQNIMRNRNIIDYDDQIYLLIELLESRPNILKILQDRYQFIMVDEFQDTNPMQSRLIDLLGGKSKNIFVVGDDDQSIYGWRGATLANILNFSKRYPSAKEVTLIENFRSTQQILDSAWRLIQNNNPDRLEHLNKLDKRLVASRGKGSEPIVMHFSRLDAELNWVAEDIAQRIKDGTEPGRIAVLARSKNTLAKVHRMLEANDIEHTVSGVTSDLYQQPAVATLIEALRCVTDPTNNISLYHTLTGRFFVCDPQVISNQLSNSHSHHEPLTSTLAELADKDIDNALAKIESWRKQSHTSVRELSIIILKDSGQLNYLSENALKDTQAAQDFQALGQWFDTLYDFEKVSTLPTSINYLDNLEALRAEGELLADDSVNILTTLPAVMTVHKAKGLEWEVVYVVDCTEYSFPSLGGSSGLQIPESLKKSVDADSRLSEERRLMYVAATRARNQLILTYSQSHNGTTKRRPSRFLEEMFDVVNDKVTPNENPVTVEELGSSTKVLKTVTLPSAMRQNGNIVLTASEANDYLLCPLNFYYRHVLNVPEAPSANAAVGTLLHGLIQEINASKQRTGNIPELKPLLKRLEDEWPVIGYDSKVQRERALKLGLSSFITLHKRLVSEPVPLAVEDPFRVLIPECKLILKGRIDAVVPDGDGVQIRDYKTSTSVETAEKAKSKTTSSNQLVMYALAWRLLHDEDPVSVSLDFVQTGQVGVVKKRADTLDKMQIKLAETAQDILDNKFPAGQNHEFCIHPL